MSHHPHSPILIVTKLKRAAADRLLRKHLGSPVAWQEAHGRASSDASPVTHYVFEADADNHTLEVMRLVARRITGARLRTTMRGRRTKAGMRARGTAVLKNLNLKKKPRPEVN